MTYANLEKGIERKIESMPLEVQREAVKRYDDLAVAKGRKAQTRLRAVSALSTLAGFANKPFEDITKEDLISYSKDLTTRYAKNTKSVVETQVKSFYKWLLGDGEVYPKRIRWLKPSRKGNDVTAEDVLTHEEIDSLVNVCDHPRDQALIMVLWESAARASELLRMKVGSFRVDRYSMTVTLKGKTGHREVRIPKAQLYVQSWLNSHPAKDDPEAPVWVGHGRSEGIKSSRLDRIVRGLQKRAGLSKRIYPHLLRHTRLTELAKKLTEAELRQFAGWGASSSMVKTYVHLSGRDILDRQAEVDGLKKAEDVEAEVSPLDPWTCSFCSKPNPSNHIFCGNCGRSEEVGLFKEKDDQLDRFLSENEDLILRWLKEKISDKEESSLA